MDKVAARSAEFRAELFREAGASLGIMAPLVEKDFWVCFTLSHLFRPSNVAKHLIFKGGTTLSKVYGIINRFSEDIDLTVDRRALGFTGESNPNNAPSRKKRDKLIEAMARACGSYVQNALRGALETSFAAVLGPPEHAPQTWRLVRDTNDREGQTLLFFYPATTQPISYIQPTVRLELGSRSDIWPTIEKPVTPYVATAAPGVFETPACMVTCLAAERTFWEKATILHQEAHRPKSKPLPPRYSRHYYDLAMLARSDVCDAALQRRDLLARVVEHKQAFFRCGWARYDLAVPNTLRLMPLASRIPDLKRDYDQTSPMIFGGVPPFDEIMEELHELETCIRALRTGHSRTEAE